MSVNFRGFAEIQDRLRRMMQPKEFNKLVDKALIKGAEVVRGKVVENLETFKDTGATVDEVVVTKPQTKKGYRLVRLGWNGPNERYRIVHLNEHGYTRNGKFYGPELKGYKQISKAVESSKPEYINTVRKEMAKKLNEML